jgi:hypothetical protein
MSSRSKFLDSQKHQAAGLNRQMDKTDENSGVGAVESILISNIADF